LRKSCRIAVRVAAMIAKDSGIRGCGGAPDGAGHRGEHGGFSVVIGAVKPLTYAQARALVTGFRRNRRKGVAGTGWSYAHFAGTETEDVSRAGGVRCHQPR